MTVAKSSFAFAAQRICPITREDALPISSRLLFGALRWNPVGRWGFHVGKLEGMRVRRETIRS